MKKHENSMNFGLPPAPRGHGRGGLWALLTAGILCGIGTLLAQMPMTGRSKTHSTVEPAAIEQGDVRQAPKFSVRIRRPAGPPPVNTGMTNANGEAIVFACNMCHAARPANGEARLGVKLTEFHQGVSGSHGNLTCISCHDSQQGYQALRLADGKSIAYPDVMLLCAQCHGLQYRDYRHGCHGGMTGHWDLTRGERSRKNCIDCHNPHTPHSPVVEPAKGPNDRFLSTTRRVGHE